MGQYKKTGGKVVELKKIFRGIVFLAFCLLPLSGRADNYYTVGGIKLTDKGCAFVIEKSEDTSVCGKFAGLFLQGLAIPDTEMICSLSVLQDYSASLFYPLYGMPMGRVLLDSDLILKHRIKAIVTNLSDAKVLAFWKQALEKGDIFNSGSVELWVKPGKVLLIELKDGLLIKQAVLEVELENVVNKTLWLDIVKPGIEKAINEEPGFKPLRDLFRVLICSQWYKERVLQGEKRPFNYIIDSRQIGGVFNISRMDFSDVRAYNNLFFEKRFIALGKRELSIFGAIDLTSTLQQSEIEKINADVNKAVKAVNLFKISGEYGFVFKDRGSAMLSRAGGFLEKNSASSKTGKSRFMRFINNLFSKGGQSKLGAVLIGGVPVYPAITKILDRGLSGIKLPAYISERGLSSAVADFLGDAPAAGRKGAQFVLLGRTAQGLSDEDAYNELLKNIEDNKALLFPYLLKKGIKFGVLITDNEAQFFSALLKKDKKRLARFLSTNARPYFFKAMDSAGKRGLGKLKEITALLALSDQYRDKISYLKVRLDWVLRSSVGLFADKVDLVNGAEVSAVDS